MLGTLWRWRFFVASPPPHCHSEEPSFQATRNLRLMVSTAEKQIPRRLKNASLGMTPFRCVALATHVEILNRH